MSLLSRHVELYEVNRGPKVMRFTPEDRGVEFNSQFYDAAAGLKRGRIAQTGSEARSELGLDVPLDFPLLSWFRPFPPSERVQLRLIKVRKSDGHTRLLWSGVLAELRDSTHKAHIRCQTRLATMATAGLRRCWQVACPHVLYGRQCGVDQNAFRVDATLFGSSAYSVQSAAFAAYADGWFSGGFIRWQVGTDIEHRFVVRHVGDTLHLLTPSALPVGTVVASFPGCDRSMPTCHEKFNNSLDYGGQHTIPRDHPFDGHAVF
ncbi:phage BR0599 family protein [Luteimonas terricola]|uniref:Bacteriophage phiJL001 Gp84 C-terminal domain-containing protein n=1 Tax=Luteimonas terricola TaxID=645597 RepID=A0ABQ2EEU2_9GAMM|nr:phage BR0599 family protein [Luteimonas terricola]GGK08514.1 hypothetical protein GCM10011394_17380 [Luteimonas terricola]